jgi:branched-chain amino acid transport system permease protein
LIGIIWLAIVVTWGVRSVVGALLAGISFTVIPVLVELHLPDSFGQVTPILFGLGAIMLARDPRGVVAHARDPRGVVAQTLFRHRDRRLRRERARLARSQTAVAT